MKIKALLLLSVCMISCTKHDVATVKAGEIIHIPYTDNLAVGTDSTIIILNRDTGVVLQKIRRKS